MHVSAGQPRLIFKLLNINNTSKIHHGRCFSNEYDLHCSSSSSSSTFHPSIIKSCTKSNGYSSNHQVTRGAPFSPLIHRPNLHPYYATTCKPVSSIRKKAIIHIQEQNTGSARHNSHLKSKSLRYSIHSSHHRCRQVVSRRGRLAAAATTSQHLIELRVKVVDNIYDVTSQSRMDDFRVQRFFLAT